MNLILNEAFCILRHLVWVCAVCLCPTKRMLGIWVNMLYLGSIGMDLVISEPCCKGTILQKKYTCIYLGNDHF